MWTSYIIQLNDLRVPFYGDLIKETYLNYHSSLKTALELVNVEVGANPNVLGYTAVKLYNHQWSSAWLNISTLL